MRGKTMPQALGMGVAEEWLATTLPYTSQSHSSAHIKTISRVGHRAAQAPTVSTCATCSSGASNTRTQRVAAPTVQNGYSVNSSWCLHPWPFTPLVKLGSHVLHRLLHSPPIHPTT